MDGKKGLYIIAWMLAVAAIAYHDMKDCHMFPRSPRIMNAGLVFTLIYLMSFFSETLAGVTAGGMVIALMINVKNPKGDKWTGECNQNGATGNPSTTAFLTGNPANPNQAAPPPFTAQPPSYGAFSPSPLPTTAQQQPPGTTLV